VSVSTVLTVLSLPINLNYYIVTPPAQVDNSGGVLPRPFRELRAAAERHQPTRVGERNASILRYVRDAKGLPNRWTPAALEGAFDLWWRNAESVVGTKDRGTSYRDFLAAWNGCHSPTTRLDVARLLAMSATVPAPEELSDREAAVYRAASLLQAWGGGTSFFLSYADAGRLVGGTTRSGQRVVGELMKRGLLERLRTGCNFEGRASTYRLKEVRP